MNYFEPLPLGVPALPPCPAAGGSKRLLTILDLLGQD